MTNKNHSDFMTNVTTNQKYTVKFNNGAWKLFNNHTFTDAGIYYLKRDADADCRDMNEVFNKKTSK